MQSTLLTPRPQVRPASSVASPLATPPAAPLVIQTIAQPTAHPAISPTAKVCWGYAIASALLPYVLAAALLALN